ncbi:MAG TPA: DUF484 family protein [Thioalkalivibrio sp.]|nr:DUF484 family protein [Thioalkalivibrio sp.]
MTTTQTERDSAAPTLSDEAVEDYLKAHPDFFDRHTGLLALMHLPHQVGGGAVSLVERQVGLLREKNRQLERKLMDLVQVARDNEHLSSRLHRLALALMEADGLDGVLATTQELLRSEFKADHVVVRLVSEQEAADSPHHVPPDHAGLAAFEELFESRRPACGRLDKHQLAFLFDEHADEVASAVAVPLFNAGRLGVLGLGSREEARFHPGMGTLFLGYLGELVSAAVQGGRGA